MVRVDPWRVLRGSPFIPADIRLAPYRESGYRLLMQALARRGDLSETG